MVETVFTYLKGIAFLLAVFLLCYPAVFVVQLLTGTVTESIGQIVGLFSLSVLAWLWVIRLYRNTEFTLEATTSEQRGNDRVRTRRVTQTFWSETDTLISTSW